MKIILSRKGFDSESGGYASPILPDGKLVSLPIPDPPNRSDIRYSDIYADSSISYYEVMKDLNSRIKIGGRWEPFTKDTRCHLDPDLIRETINRKHNWRAALGQIDQAQSHLSDRAVGTGDLFLFFGWFRQTLSKNGRLCFDTDNGKHIIFGYLEVEEVIRANQATKIPDYLREHIHAHPSRINNPSNTVYIARDRLSLDPTLPGYGILNYHFSLVLSKDGHPKSHWNLPTHFRNVAISYHKPTSWKDNYFQAAARGQEFVIQSKNEQINWALNLIRKNSKQRN